MITPQIGPRSRRARVRACRRPAQGWRRRS